MQEKENDETVITLPQGNDRVEQAVKERMRECATAMVIDIGSLRIQYEFLLLVPLLNKGRVSVRQTYDSIIARKAPMNASEFSRAVEAVRRLVCVR